MSNDTHGPQATATFGSDFNPAVPPYLDNPYPFYAQAQREAPIRYSPQLDMWLVTRYADILAVLKDPMHFSSADTMELRPEVQAVFQAQGYPEVPGLFNNDPPSHTRVHAQFSHAFSAGKIALMEPTIRALAHSLIDGFAPDGQPEPAPRPRVWDSLLHRGAAGPPGGPGRSGGAPRAPAQSPTGARVHP